MDEYDDNTGYSVLLHVEGDAPVDALATELAALGLELDDIEEALVAADQEEVLVWCSRRGVQTRTFSDRDGRSKMIADMISSANSAIILSGGKKDVDSSDAILIIGSCMAMRVPFSAKVL